jgi:hypothetical protein
MSTNPGFVLQWRELDRMQSSGVWDIQEHAGIGHSGVLVDESGNIGPFYAYREYLPRGNGSGGRLESFAQYQARVTSDIIWGQTQLATHLPRYRPYAFAVPYGNYGQEATNDDRIPNFLLDWLNQTFGVVFGGDYLDQGADRPYEPKGRLTPQLSYRIDQGPALTVSGLYCRLRNFVTNTPLWQEYRCLHAAQLAVPPALLDRIRPPMVPEWMHREELLAVHRADHHG